MDDTDFRHPLQELRPILETPQVHFAGFWIRVAATLLDTLFLIGLNMLIFNPLRRAWGVMDAYLSFVDLIEIVIDLLYLVLLTWLTGQTLGKIITGIRVINARQSRGNLTVGQVFLREVIGKFLSSLPFSLGYLWVGWNRRKQGWHDLLAKTYVIYERRA